MQVQNYSEENLQCFLSLVSEGLKRNNHGHLITNECEKRSKRSEINGKLHYQTTTQKPFEKSMMGRLISTLSGTRQNTNQSFLKRKMTEWQPWRMGCQLESIREKAVPNQTAK